MSTRNLWNKDRELLLQSYSSWLSNTKDFMADDRPIAQRRKRRTSSSAHGNVNHNGVGTSGPGADVDATRVEPATRRTPKKAKKKARFTDSPPNGRASDAGTTGLTPAASRTSISSASRSRPRRPTPYRRRSDSIDTSVQIIQFTPLVQQLDPRTKRRLSRNRLSEEMNRIEQSAREREKLRKDETERLRKQLQIKGEEVARLQDQLQAVKGFRSEDKAKLADLEHERLQLQGQLAESMSAESNDDNHDDLPLPGSDIEMVTYTAHDPETNFFPLTPSRQQRSSMSHAEVQTSMFDFHHEAEITAISIEYEDQLEGAKQEKRDLFNRLRPHFSSSQLGLGSRDSTPTPENLNKLADTLLVTKSRANEAEDALSALWAELEAFGFPGDGREAIVNEMKQQFRQARLELERTVPGETDFGFEPAKLVPAMIKHIQDLAVQLHDKEIEIGGMHDRHAALSGQFDVTLGRLSNAARRISELEETIDTGAEEMLEVRMTIQRLERELGEKDVGISRLIAASDKYRDDIQSLERLVKNMEHHHEEQQKLSKTQMDEAIADLECKVAAEEKGRRSAEMTSSQRGDRILQLEVSLESSKTYASEVERNLETLKFEKEELNASIHDKLSSQEEKHALHLGGLNVRISNLTTALDSANAEVAKLKAIKEKLEKRVREEFDTAKEVMDAMQERQLRSVAKNNEIRKSYLRKSKIRYANDEIDEDEVLQERGPLTPDSAVRFVDFVEVGRGKHRRKFDSGIGVLSEEEADEDFRSDPLSEGDIAAESRTMDLEPVTPVI